MENPNNGSAAQGWGSSCSRVLGPNGEMTYVLQDNQVPTYSAGYGRLFLLGGWSIDEYGKSYEWAQPNILTSYSDAMYTRGAKEIAKDCVAYGIPPVFITVFDQAIQPVPTGLVRHDRCENGTKLGKSDPGLQFNEAKFIALLQAEIAALENDMTKEEMIAVLRSQTAFPELGGKSLVEFMQAVDNYGRQVDAQAARAAAKVYEEAP